VTHAFNPSTWEAEAGTARATQKTCLKKKKKKKINSSGSPGTHFVVHVSLKLTEIYLTSFSVLRLRVYVTITMLQILK
jgi:hypothetical protein